MKAKKKNKVTRRYNRMRILKIDCDCEVDIFEYVIVSSQTFEMISIWNVQRQN